MLGWLAPLLLPFVWPAHRAHQRALMNPARAQREVLQRILKSAAKTRYVQARGIDTSSVDGFLRTAPLCVYNDVAPFIEAQRAGERGALLDGDVVTYEPTSGSSGAAKWIPYNAKLLATFRQMFSAWVYDVVKNGPGFRHAKFYFSISPSVHDSGLDDDRAYMSRFFRLVLSRFFVRPAEIEKEKDPERFLTRTVAALFSEANLEIVSVWSPTFLSALLTHARHHPDAVLACMRDEFGAAPSRGERVQAFLSGGPLRDVWPGLRFLSFWDLGHAADPAATLREELPHVTCQGKGLLMTEGPITLPYLGHEGVQAPLCHLVYLELLDDAGQLIPLVEGAAGQTYEVVLTQPGGLLRYRTHDRVRIEGHFHKCPGLVFVGRADTCSDLVGEKLSERFVAEVLGEQGITSSVLAPAANRAAYVLLTESHSVDAAAIDDALAAAHHYGLARRLGQLGPVEVQRVDSVADTALAAWTAAGKKVGDYKPGPLLLVRLPPTSLRAPSATAPDALRG